jgi:hypothetical protein
MRIWKTMEVRVRRDAAWMVCAIVVAAVACSDDEPSGSSLKCGEGTVRSGHECVASETGGSAGNAGASTGGSRTGGTGGATAGTAGSGVTDGGDGGDHANGGTDAGTSGTGGGAGSGGNAGSGVAGAGMGGTAGTAGAGGAAGGGGTGGVRTSHWLAYQHEAGIFAYDVGTFPEPTGTLLAASGSFPTSYDALGNAPINPWSPDGSKLVYISAGNLFVVDATTTTLGAPVNLGTAWSIVEWSGDSKSLYLFAEARVIDVSQAAPIRRPIVSTGITFGAWAPLGNRFAYIDSTGLNVVSVVAGVPGQSTHLADGATEFVWSPDATRLAAWVGGELFIVDLRGASAVVTDVTNPAAASPSVSNPMFSKDSSRLVYSGRQARDVIDFYVVNTASPSGSARVALPAIADGVRGTYGWATNHNWVRWTAISSATEGAVVADLSGSMPASAALPAGSGYQWVPGELKLLARNAADDLVLVDATAPAAVPRVIAPTSGSTFSMGGPGSAIAYEVVDVYFRLVDLAGMQGGIVTFTGGAGSNPTWKWSRDAQFIALASTHSGTTPADYSLHVMRVDGVNASSAARLQERSRGVSTTFAWQP